MVSELFWRNDVIPPGDTFLACYIYIYCVYKIYIYMYIILDYDYLKMARLCILQQRLQDFI